MDVESIEEQRARVVAVARTWVGCPYHHCARIKGVGIDCATFLAECYHEAQVVPRVVLPAYSPQWYLHREKEWFLEVLTQYAVETTSPRRGDAAIYKIGRCYAHGAITLEDGWPSRIIHASRPARRVIEAGGLDGDLLMHQSGPQRGRAREVRFFTPWGPHGESVPDQQQR